MMCVTFRFLATGSFLEVAGDFGGIHKSTTSRKIYLALRAIAGLSRLLVKMPSNEDERAVVRTGFFNIASLPRCIDALDCTHVKVQSPGGINAETYRNRKRFFFNLTFRQFAMLNYSFKMLSADGPDLRMMQIYLGTVE